VGRPHGLDGSFYVTGPRPRLLSLGKTVEVAGVAREIVRCAGTESRPILRLQGVEDRTAADALRGQELTVEQRDAPALEPGEWWAHELLGCEVRDSDVTVGRVVRMIELPSCEALEVQPGDGSAPLLIPMVKDAIRAVDVARQAIEVNLSFLGLEAPAGRSPEPASQPPQRSEGR
jgi:16S rRNA processing protein RimM